MQIRVKTCVFTFLTLRTVTLITAENVINGACNYCSKESTYGECQHGITVVSLVVGLQSVNVFFIINICPRVNSRSPVVATLVRREKCQTVVVLFCVRKSLLLISFSAGFYTA